MMATGHRVSPHISWGGLPSEWQQWSYVKSKNVAVYIELHSLCTKKTLSCNRLLLHNPLSHADAKHVVWCRWGEQGRVSTQFLHCQAPSLRRCRARPSICLREGKMQSDISVQFSRTLQSFHMLFSRAELYLLLVICLSHHTPSGGSVGMVVDSRC